MPRPRPPLSHECRNSHCARPDCIFCLPSAHVRAWLTRCASGHMFSHTLPCSFSLGRVMGPRQRPHAARDSCYLVEGLTLALRAPARPARHARSRPPAARSWHAQHARSPSACCAQSAQPRAPSACQRPASSSMGSSPFQGLHQIFFFFLIIIIFFFQLFPAAGKITKIIIINFFFHFLGHSNKF